MIKNTNIQQHWLTYLLAAKALDDLQAEQARSSSEHDKQNIWDVLEESGVLNLQAQMLTIAHALGTEVVELSEAECQKLKHLLPAKEAIHHQCVPVRETQDEIWIAPVNPFSESLVGLEFITKKLIKPVLANPEDVERLLHALYLRNIEVQDLVTTVANKARVAPPEVLDNNSPIAKLVSQLLQQAVEGKASDIHFEPFEDQFKVRFRIDGALRQIKTLPINLASSLISRLKVLGDLDIAEKRKPQDGRLKFRTSVKTVDLRISCLPTQFGESVVLRVLDRTVFSPQLTELGLRPQDVEKLDYQLLQPNGIVLVTGPTGSGKTTTLYSCLNLLNTPDVKIVTAEDPVEYEIRGMMQVPIRDEIGLTFQKALRSFLRQDPDIIMIGEMRDVETAQIAIQSSLTGHLVLSTLHTNNAPASITRLLDMGVEPFLLASTLSCVLAQRLVRTICPQCKKPQIPDEKTIKKLGFTPEDLGNRTFYVGAGCDNCNHTGFKGRRGLYELMVVDEAIRQMIANSEPTPQIRQKAIENGMTTLRADGIRNILAGVTSFDEVIRFT